MRDVGGEAEWAEEAVRFEEDEAMVLEEMSERGKQEKKKKKLT